MGNSVGAPQRRVAERYLRPMPTGVIRWIAGDAGRTRHNQNERKVFQQILLGPNQQRVDPDAVAARTGLTRVEVGKALFALNRDGSILIDARADELETEERIWRTLVRHVRAMGERHGQQSIVVADPDGLCIASTRADEETSQRMASGHALHDMASPVHRVELHLGDRPFWLASVGPLREDDPGWVMIARCLETIRPRDTREASTSETASDSG